MSLKLSQIADGGAVSPTTDKFVTVRNGATDVLTTPGQAAAKAVSNNANPTVASVDTGGISASHFAVFADTAGTVADGGVVGTAANQAASSITGTVAAVSGGVTAGHIAVFSNTAGTIQDGGAPGTGFVPTSRTVNGHALSADVVVSASDLTTGTLPAAQLPLATTGAFGAVKPDGSTVTISAGIISAVAGSPAQLASSLSGSAAAAGTNALSLGIASATGNNSIFIGSSGAGATGNDSTGIGIGIVIAGDNCVSIGSGAAANQNNCISIGKGATNNSQADTIMIGVGASATNVHQILIKNSFYQLFVDTGGTFHIPCAAGVLLQTPNTLSDGAAAALGTLSNAPTAGNPTKWIPINDNGTVRYIPAW